MVSSDEPRAWIVRFDAGAGANYIEPLLSIPSSDPSDIANGTS